MKVKNFFIKILTVFSIFQILIFPVCFTPKAEALNWDNLIGMADGWIKRGRDNINSGDGPRVAQSDIKKANDTLFLTLYAIAAVISVIIGGILGIQFMIASAEDKAKIKEALLPYIIGCIVAFGSIGIWRIIISVLNGL